MHKICDCCRQQAELAAASEKSGTSTKGTTANRRQFGLGFMTAGLGLVSGLATQELVLRSVAEAQKRKFYAKRFRGKKAPKLRVGKWIRKEVPLKGKPMLIKFFASWCNVCQRSISPLNRLQREFDGKLRVIAISDEPERLIRNFIGTRAKFSVCQDSKSKTFKKYGIEGVFPHFVMVSKSGYVRTEGPLPIHDYAKLKKRIGKYV